MTPVNLTIDGQTYTGRAGQTLLEVCQEQGIDVPTLCHYEGLPDVGACRLCIVEVEGGGRPVPACTTPVQLTRMSASAELTAATSASLFSASSAKLSATSSG